MNNIKKLLVLLMALSILFTFFACDKNDEKTEGQTKSITTEKSPKAKTPETTSNSDLTTNNASTALTTTTTTKASAKSKASQNTPVNNSTSTTKESTCQHTFTSTVTPATCTQDGYTLYTCSKCGYSYKDIIPAYHKSTGYYCPSCGKADTTHPYEALINYLKIEGKYSNGSYYIGGTKSGFDCLVNYSKSQNILIFASNYNKKSDDGTLHTYKTYISIPCIKDSYECDFNFDNKVVASTTITPSSYTSSSTVLFTDFKCNEPDPQKYEEYKISCQNAASQLLNNTLIVESYILKNTNTGLNITQFRFNNY